MPDYSQEPNLQGGGECGALLRSLDWTSNPLGPPATWPDELISNVGVALASKQPMLIVWGPQQVTLYNDGYAAMCGARHPAALGGSFKALWFDIWDQVEPIISAAYNGVSTSMDDIEFIMHRNGYPEETHFSFSYNPVRNRAGDVLGMICPCTETTAIVAQRNEERVERSGFLQIFDVALGAIALLSGPDHVFRYVNAEYEKLIGHRNVVGKTVRAGLPEIVDQGLIELLTSVYRSGKPHVGRNIPIRLKSSPDGPLETRMIDFLYNPIRGEEGDVNGIFVQAIDVTERLEEEKQQILRNREIGHRMKNQLTVVQAIVAQTFRNATDMKLAVKSVNDRLRVLAASHDMLIEGTTPHTSVREIVRTVLLLHDDEAGSRFRVDGPDVEVGGRAALSLALILHELATNAVKHGALSTPDGFVNISWQVARNSEEILKFEFTWREEGGPPVVEPQRLGTGSRLIQAGLDGTIGRETRLEFAEGGLCCEIIAELASFQHD